MKHEKRARLAPDELRRRRMVDRLLTLRWPQPELLQVDAFVARVECAERAVAILFESEEAAR